jgi:hypothetical protein
VQIARDGVKRGSIEFVAWHRSMLASLLKMG